MTTPSARPSATETFSPLDAVELAVVERSGFVESRHSGSAVVLAPDGAVLRTLGDVVTPVFPRSCLKPAQAATVLALGADLTGVPAALATASHAGTDAHVAVVAEMLASADLSASDLGCPVSMPSDGATRTAMTLRGEEASRLRMNCSGKHAAMLLACRAQGWPTEGYLDPAHPLQVAIAATIERAAGEPIAATGVDGCGAPVFALSLVGLARVVRWFARAEATSSDPLEVGAAVVHEAVLAHPWAIDGEGRDNTLVIAELGAFAKGGAEGVIVMATPSGHVVALKVLDGSSRATTVVALELLVQAGALERSAVADLLQRLPLEVRGGDGVVGTIRAVI